MLGLNCLMKNAQIKDNLRDLVAYTGYQLMEAGKVPSIENVYASLRQTIEVDIQTVSHFYRESFDLEDPMFSSKDEVDAAAGQGLRDVFNKVAQEVRLNETGRDSEIVFAIRSMFNAITPSLNADPSLRKLFQDRLTRVALGFLPKELRANAATRSSEQNLTEALLLKKNNDFHGLGTLENGAALFTEFKRQMNLAADEAEKEENNHFRAAEIRQFADIVSQQTVKLLLSTQESRKAILDGLKKAGYAVTVSNRFGRQVETIDWNKLFNTKGVTFYSIMKDAFGPIMSQQEVEYISRSLKDQFEQILLEKRAGMLAERQAPSTIATAKDIPDVLRNALGLANGIRGNFFLRKSEQVRIVNEVVKYAKGGYYTGTNMLGKKIINWKAMFNDQTFDYKAELTGYLKSNGFDAAEIEAVFDNTNTLYEDNLKEKKEKRIDTIERDRKKPVQNTAMERLLSLASLGIFERGTKKAMLDMLGVTKATAQRIESMRRIVEIQQMIIDTPFLDAKVSPSSNLPIETTVATFNYTAANITWRKSLEREMEILIEQTEEDNDLSVKMIRMAIFAKQSANAATLSNPKNISENTLTGVIHGLFMAMSNPHQMLHALRIAFVVGGDVVQGGVREGDQKSNMFNSMASNEERFNLETAKTTGAKVMAYKNLLSRILLSAMDNGVKAGMTHMVAVKRLREYLMTVHDLKSHEANVLINDGLWGNRAEIEKMAKMYERLMPEVGINAAAGKWRRMAAEMARLNLISDGKYFQDLLVKLKAKGDIRNSVNPTITAELLQSCYDAAHATAGSALGHEADNKLMEMADNARKGLNDGVTAARKNNGEGLASAEAKRLAASSVDTFRPGSLKWYWLTMQKFSGYSLGMTLLTDVLWPNRSINPVKMGKGMWKTVFGGDGSIDYGLEPKEVTKQMAGMSRLSARLVREMVGPIVSIKILPAVLMYMFGVDGDDDDKKSAIRKFAIDMANSPVMNAWMKKMMPAPIYAYFTSMAYVNDYGKVVRANEKQVKAMPPPGSLSQAFSYDMIVQNLRDTYNQSQIETIIGDLKKTTGLKKDKALGQMGVTVGNILNVLPELKLMEAWSSSFQPSPKKETADEKTAARPTTVGGGIAKGLLGKKGYKVAKDVFK